MPMTGHYLFLSVSPEDPHPEEKHGHIFHLGADKWQGGPTDYLPSDPRYTFMSNQALWINSGMLDGPLTSAVHITKEGPVRQLQDGSELPKKLDQTLIAPKYQKPAVRAAIKMVALLAIYDYAHDNAEKVRALPVSPPNGYDPFTTQVRSWIMRKPWVDPKLRLLWDSFIPRVSCALTPPKSGVAL